MHTTHIFKIEPQNFNFVIQRINNSDNFFYYKSIFEKVSEKYRFL